MVLSDILKTKRKRRSAQETRDLLLKAAEAEMVEGGGMLEMATLARRAELSEGLAYHYFGNRAGVIAAVIDRFFDRYEATIIDVAFEGDTWQTREKCRVAALVKFYAENPLTLVIFSRLGSDAEVTEVESRRSRRQIDLAANNILRAQERGDIAKERDARLLGAMMLGAIRWAMMSAWQEPVAIDPDKLTAEIWNTIKAMSHT
jgi:AcrR family transcriptional regulator